MFKSPIHSLVIGGLALLSAIAGANPLYADDSVTPGEIRQIISERLQMYRRSFPGINFVHAAGGKRWREDYAAIVKLLGKAPVSLDYEHPPALAADLMAVSMRRLELVLRENMMSSSLFGTDKDSPLHGAPLCVITLNPQIQINDNRSATAYMLDLPDALLSRIHPARLLDARDHLRFTLDHEIFHCLESARIGGAPMTRETYGGEYNVYHRENGADAYALAMHRRQPGSSPGYAPNLVLVRALWFLSDGPCYDTYLPLREILLIPKADLERRNIEELFELAIEVRNRHHLELEPFLDQHAVALQAARRLGFEPLLYGEHWADLATRNTDQQRVEYTAIRYHYLYRRLFDDAPVEFSAATRQ